MSRQPDFSTKPRPSRLRLWERTTVGIGALAVVVVAGAAWRAWREREEAATRLAEVRRQVSLEAAQLKGRARGAAAAGAPARSTPAQIVAGVASVLPKEARLQGLTIDYSRGVALELRVETRNAAAWDRLLESLDKSPQFGEVEPGPESRDAEVRSVVRARWTGGGR